MPIMDKFAPFFNLNCQKKDFTIRKNWHRIQLSIRKYVDGERSTRKCQKRMAPRKRAESA